MPTVLSENYPKILYNIFMPIKKFSLKRILPLLSLVIFGPTLFAYFSGEDFIFMRFAASHRAFYEASQTLFYRPIPNLLWELDYTLWNLNPAGYHLTNLIIHALNVFLVGVVVAQFSSDAKLSFATSLFFALQPLHAEPIAWLAARPDLLATFFFLLALIFTHQFLQSPTWPKHSLILLAYTIGLFCKEAIIGFPLIWLVLAARQKLPFAALCLKFTTFLIADGLYLVVRLQVLEGLGGYSNDGNGLFYVLWNATFGLWLPLLFPINYEAIGIILALPLLLGLTACYVWLIKKLNFQAIWLALLLIYAGMLPALASSPVNSDLSQSRLLYLPSIGFCLLLAACKPNHWQIGLLSLLYAISLTIACFTWLDGSNQLAISLDRLKTTTLPLQSGDTIYYTGLPDSYNGVYLWRNGLNEAVNLFVNPQIEGIRRIDDVIVDYRKTKQGQLWFFDHSHDFVYSVGDNFENALATYDWDFTDCDNLWQSQSGRGKVTCEKKIGWLFDTQANKTTLTLSSPLIKSSSTKARLEITAYVDYDFQQPEIATDFFLTNEAGQPFYTQSIELVADGRKHRYSLYLPMNLPTTFKINLRPARFRTNILWQRISYKEQF